MKRGGGSTEKKPWNVVKGEKEAKLACSRQNNVLPHRLPARGCFNRPSPLPSAEAWTGLLA